MLQKLSVLDHNLCVSEHQAFHIQQYILFSHKDVFKGNIKLVL